MAQRLRQILIDARDASGMNQTDVGKAVGMSQSFCSSYEPGQRRLDVPEFVALCRVLNVDPHEVLDRVMGR